MDEYRLAVFAVIFFSALFLGTFIAAIALLVIGAV